LNTSYSPNDIQVQMYDDSMNNPGIIIIFIF